MKKFVAFNSILLYYDWTEESMGLCILINSDKTSEKQRWGVGNGGNKAWLSTSKIILIKTHQT